MKQFVIYICLNFISNLLIFSQETEEIKTFTPKGTAYVRAFSNFHADLDKNNTLYRFELNRAYLGYKYELSENFTGNFCLDIDNPKNGSALENTAFIKYAALVYNKSKFNFAFGLIGLEHVKTQEDFWGYRYIYKSFLDNHKFTHTADLGATIKYQLLENLRIDATLRNGEGYKLKASDNTLRFGYGLAYKAFDAIIIRAYYDIYEKGEMQQIISGFIGYNLKDKFRIGAEYNYLINDSWVADKNKSGLSVYSTYMFNKKFEIFGRFDMLNSNIIKSDTLAWNINNDGKTIIAGIQYSPVKNVKTSLNYQSWIANKANTYQTNSIFFSLEYRF